MPHCPSPVPRRPGTTLVEIVAVLALVTIATGVALPRAKRAVDRIAVQNATLTIAGACALARGGAIMRSGYASVTIDTVAAAVLVTAGNDTLLSHSLIDGGSLTLSASRTTVTYGPTGLGFGASNTRVIARQGEAADTLYTSRLGRVRR